MLMQIKCVCNKDIQYYDVDGDCLLCTTGLCDTCIDYNECLNCQPSTLRILDGTDYFDDGDENFVCKCKLCKL